MIYHCSCDSWTPGRVIEKINLYANAHKKSKTLILIKLMGDEVVEQEAGCPDGF
jgi:hypothetical protein